MASEICPLCLAAVGRAASFTCPGCKSKYHKDCAAEAGDCIVAGCRAAAQAKSTPPRVTNALDSRKTTKPTANFGIFTKTPTRNIVFGAIFTVAIASGIGYSLGDSRGYSRGYSSGQTDGYASGKSDGYTAGNADGDAAGYRRGYAEGARYGCEWVFDRAGFYSYVTAYDPYSFYNKYPGRYYISKSNCP